MPLTSATIACACGACYERREVRLPIKDIGVFECDECGVRLEHWSGRLVPVFSRIRLRTPDLRRA
jgi:hypothetical protein